MLVYMLAYVVNPFTNKKCNCQTSGIPTWTTNAGGYVSQGSLCK